MQTETHCSFEIHPFLNFVLQWFGQKIIEMHILVKITYKDALYMGKWLCRNVYIRQNCSQKCVLLGEI